MILEVRVSNCYIVNSCMQHLQRLMSFRTHYMVCHQQKRRIFCAALLGRGLVIIYSFSRMLLVSCLTLKSKLPGVHYRVPELLTGRLETAFQDMIGSRASMRLHEPLPMRHSRP